MGGESTGSVWNLYPKGVCDLMRVLLVHNAYGKFSGEESVVAAQAMLLQTKGHDVLGYNRSSAELSSLADRFKAFFAGICNPKAARQMRKLLTEFRPDIVHIHNLFPLISPSVLPECHEAKVPVVMTVHNFRLICPNGLFMSRGRICERCSGGREYWCILRNCEVSVPKSIGYALRNSVARKKRYFVDNVTIYAALTEFQRTKMITEGFKAETIVVIPNMVDIQSPCGANGIGDYVGFVGRVSPEKGVNVLIEAAKKLGSIRFRVAGDFIRKPRIIQDIPSNVECCGFLQGKDLNIFRQQMRFVVMPSIWFETFGLVLAEAALYGKPVIASRLGAMAEIVDDGVTGLLFEPGNAEDLAEKIRYLWDRPELCRKMGQAGREKALREYSPQRYYERLMAVYEKAMALGPGLC